MDSFSATIRGMANAGEERKVFNWDMAAQLILEYKPVEASAGLIEDWYWTGGRIWEEGKPIPAEDTYTYLASNWATPTLLLDDQEFSCWIMETEAKERWGQDADLPRLYYPKSALRILGLAGE